MTSEGKTVMCAKEPFVATVPVKEGGGMAVEVGFHAHYGEPPLKLSVRLDGERQQAIARMAELHLISLLPCSARGNGGHLIQPIHLPVGGVQR